MISLDSKHLAALDYDEETNSLTIEFARGGRYKYFSVPQDVYEGLLVAESKSDYFRNSIKNVFQFMRVM